MHGALTNLHENNDRLMSIQTIDMAYQSDNRIERIELKEIPRSGQTVEASSRKLKYPDLRALSAAWTIL